MSDPKDLPPELPDPLRVRCEELFRSYGVAPEEAARILEDSAVEAWYRKRVSTDQEARFLRAVERRCRAHKEALRRRALEALDEADEPESGER
jgi:hypothetical protein